MDTTDEDTDWAGTLTCGCESPLLVSVAGEDSVDEERDGDLIEELSNADEEIADGDGSESGGEAEEDEEDSGECIEDGSRESVKEASDDGDVTEDEDSEEVTADSSTLELLTFEFGTVDAEGEEDSEKGSSSGTIGMSSSQLSTSSS
jgi:hypothetical protein